MHRTWKRLKESLFITAPQNLLAGVPDRFTSNQKEVPVASSKTWVLRPLLAAGAMALWTVLFVTPARGRSADPYRDATA